jgi:hypothetical protein
MRPYYIFAIDGKTVMSYEKPCFETAKVGYIFANKDGDIKFVLPETSKEEPKQVLPDEPIDVASMLINATITVEPSKFGTLSPLHDKEPQIFAKYDTNQLQEIAEHLLMYCEAQERGFKDACCENCEP